MSEYTEYPLSIRDVMPSPDAQLITGHRKDGLPDGIHTGGAYLVKVEGKRYPEVWKPLDGRPYANSEVHLSTLEDVALEELSDLSMFPKNWRVEEKNGRRWLVRTQALVLFQYEGLESMLETEDVLEVERCINEMNRRGWMIADAITLAYDRELSQWFILDLSVAWKRKKIIDPIDSESWRVLQFFKEVGADNIVKLRDRGRHMVTSCEFWKEHGGGWNYVYASFNRPFSLMWASLPNKEVILIDEKYGKWSEMIPWTWIITREPIPDDKLTSYELKLAWLRVITERITLEAS